MNKSIQEAAGQAQAENHDRREIERLTAALAERSARAAEVETCLREWLSAYRPGVPLGTLAHVITRARKLVLPPSEEEPPTVPPQRDAVMHERERCEAIVRELVAALQTGGANGGQVSLAQLALAAIRTGKDFSR